MMSGDFSSSYTVLNRNPTLWGYHLEKTRSLKLSRRVVARAVQHVFIFQGYVLTLDVY